MSPEHGFETKQNDGDKSLDSNYMGAQPAFDRCARKTSMLVEQRDNRLIDRTITHLEFPSLDDDEDSMMDETDCSGALCFNNQNVIHQLLFEPIDSNIVSSNARIYDQIWANGYVAVGAPLLPTNQTRVLTLSPRHHFDPDELLSIRINHKSVVDIISNNPVITKSKGCNAYTIEGKSVQN